MDDFDTAKENIQPLASGRNASHLETALAAESDSANKARLVEQRKEFERAIHEYDGDDPLQLWYDYIVWVEQVYPKSGSESALHELVGKCLTKFEKDDRYLQDQRLLKLFIKYIDAEHDPPQFYEQLYENGIGTMLAELYICWAHYHDYCDNFEKAESVYRKGLNARAQPLDQLEQAHRQFGFSMSQRILHKDDESRQQFRSTMEEKRMALTSLRSLKHNRVGSIRTGAAIREHNPGRVEQHGQPTGNRRVQVFQDDQPADHGAANEPPSTSVVQSIISSARQQENRREPGPWSNPKAQASAVFPTDRSAKVSFSILSDDDRIPLAEKDNMFKRGIQLPPTHRSKNAPQNKFDVPAHRDDEPSRNSMVGYDKFLCGPWLPVSYFPGLDTKSFSPEEIRMYQMCKKRGINTNLTKELDPILGNGPDFPIRLPVHFVRESAPQTYAMELSPFDPWAPYAATFPTIRVANDLDAIYTPDEEFSMEELLRKRWIKGEMASQKESEMEMTCAFERRIEGRQAAINRRSTILMGRPSIAPAAEVSAKPDDRRDLGASRKSVIVTENEEPTATASTAAPTATANDTDRTSILAGPTRPSLLAKRKSTARVSFLDPVLEVSSPPVTRRRSDDAVHPTKPIEKTEATTLPAKEEDDAVFKVPQAAAAAKAPQPLFAETHDDDLENCNTQIFNFYIQSQSVSTPKVVKAQAAIAPPNSIQRQLAYDDESDEHPDDARSVARQPFACHAVDTEHHVIEAPELYRHKLSAIMETTEEAGTISSNPSKTSSAEDFDYTKHTNTHVSTMSHRSNCHTIINNTARASSTVISFKDEHRSLANVDNLTKLEEFEKTLPASGQFCIYEDEQEEAASLVAQNKSKSMLKEATMAGVSFAPIDVSHVPANRSLVPANVSFTPARAPATSGNDVSEFGLPQVTEKLQHLATHVDNTPQPKRLGNRPLFQVPNEETGKTVPMDFNVERTSPLWPRRTEMTAANDLGLGVESVMELPSMCAPSIPMFDDSMKIPSLSPAKAVETSVRNTSTLKLAKDTAEKSVFAIPTDNTEKSIFTMPTQHTDRSIFAVPTDNTESSIFALPAQITEKSIFAVPTENTEKSMFALPTENTEKSMFALPTEDTEKSMWAPGPDASKSISAMSLSKANPVNANATNKTANRSLFALFTDEPEDSFAVSSPPPPSKPGTSAPNELSRVEQPPQPVFNIFHDDTDFIPLITAARPIGNETIMNLQENRKPNESLKQNATASKSMFRNNDDELYAMIQSPPIGKNASLFGVKAKVNDAVEVKVSESVKKATIDDDELYSLIKSPPGAPSTNMTAMPKASLGGANLSSRFQTTQPRLGIEQSNKSMSTTENVLAKTQTQRELLSVIVKQEVRDEDVSEPLVEPMKDVSIGNSAKFDTGDTEKLNKPLFFSEENPNTAMFAFHLPSISNSTVLIPSSMTATNMPADQGVHSEQLIDAVLPEDSASTMPADAPNDFLDLSIEIDAHELAMFAAPAAVRKTQANPVPTFQISAPVSIRPSQFNMNETPSQSIVKPNDTIDTHELSTQSTTSSLTVASTSAQQTQRSRPSCAYIKTEKKDASILVIDDSMNSSSGTVSREKMTSPFKYKSRNKDIDPFDVHVQNALLDDIHFIDYIEQLDNVFVTTRIRPIEVNSDLILDTSTIEIDEQIGQGSFGFVYSGKCSKTKKKFALKQERPANLWEFYISLEIASRVEDKFLLSGFLQIEHALIGHNSSVYISELSEFGSLYNLCNRHNQLTCRPIDEIIVMILAEQMLRVLDHLHAANIIHGDIKPDNFLLMKRLSYGRSEMFIKLIDFGRAIDLNFFPPNQTFTTILDTKNFVCTEMLEQRPWKQQLDLFCMASTIYTLLCGKYMNVRKQPNSRLRPYAIVGEFEPYLEVQLWEQVLYALINVRDCSSLPNLQQIRTDICETIASKEHLVDDKVRRFNNILNA